MLTFHCTSFFYILFSLVSCLKFVDFNLKLSLHHYKFCGVDLSDKVTSDTGRDEVLDVLVKSGFGLGDV